MLAHRRLLLLLAVAAAAAASGTAIAKPTAYEVLADYDFPPGILPKGVVSYTLDNATGAFTATLDGSSSCEFSIQGSYTLRYKTEISGTIATDHLTDLEGVSVKVLLFWLNIVEVTRSGDNLEFSIGIVSADFGVDNFLESPTCGCGFDCDDLLMLQKQPGAATAKLRLRGAF
jgi:hypothetical protein